LDAVEETRIWTLWRRHAFGRCGGDTHLDAVEETRIWTLWRRHVFLSLAEKQTVTPRLPIPQPVHYSDWATQIPFALYEKIIPILRTRTITARSRYAKGKFKVPSRSTKIFFPRYLDASVRYCAMRWRRMPKHSVEHFKCSWPKRHCSYGVNRLKREPSALLQTIQHIFVTVRMTGHSNYSSAPCFICP